MLPQDAEGLDHPSNSSPRPTIRPDLVITSPFTHLAGRAKDPGRHPGTSSRAGPSGKTAAPSDVVVEDIRTLMDHPGQGISRPRKSGGPGSRPLSGPGHDRTDHADEGGA